MIFNPACTVLCYGDVKKKKNEERREVTQLWIRPQPVPLRTCPDIKQSWNLTHTSYIDLHSLVRPFEGPWRPLYPSVCVCVCVKLKCEGVVPVKRIVLILKLVLSTRGKVCRFFVQLSQGRRALLISRFWICFSQKAQNLHLLWEPPWVSGMPAIDD